MAPRFRYNGPMRSRLLLILWLLGILFPMAYLGTRWPVFGHLFNATFAADWVHVVMHSFLYTVLGILLMRWVKPTSIQSSLLILGLGLLVGCCHEGLQILTAGHWPGWPAETVDLGVDLAGTAIGLILSWIWIYHKGHSPLRLLR